MINAKIYAYLPCKYTYLRKCLQIQKSLHIHAHLHIHLHTHLHLHIYISYDIYTCTYALASTYTCAYAHALDCVEPAFGLLQPLQRALPIHQISENRHFHLEQQDRR